VAERPNAASAMAAARACGGRVEIASERSEIVQVFANPDGSRTLEESMEPQRVRKGSTWVSVDVALHKVAGGIGPRAAVLPLVFSPGGIGPLAKLSSGPHELSMTWPGSLPEPLLDGPVALYREILPGVDLRVTASALGFSEVLVVKTPEAAKHPKLASLKFGLAAKGLSVVTTSAGGLEARDSLGKAIFSAPTPLMWDSTPDPEAPSGPDAKPAPSTAAPAKPLPSKGASAKTAETQAAQDQLEVAKEPAASDEPLRRAIMPVRVSGGELTLVPDQKLLTDPRTKYPVYIDPSWTGGIASNAWTAVWSKYPNSSFWQNLTALLNGSTKGSAGAGRTEDCSGCADHIIRSFFRMDTSRVVGLHIIAATFRVEQLWSWTCSPSSNAKVWLTSAISSGNTWNNPPSFDSNYTAQTPGNRKLGAVHGCLGSGTIEFNVTHFVTRAAASGWSNVTVGLRAVDEGTLYQWKRFNHTSPKLAITFNTKPNVPTDRLSDGKTCATGTSRPYVLTTTPTLAVKQSDPDTDQQSLTTWLYWWAVGGTRNETDKMSMAAGNPGTISKAIPSGRLSDGASYVWQAYTTDGTDSGGWSGTCEFTVDATPPPIPGSVTSTDYPQSGVAGGVNIPGVFHVVAPATRPEEILAYAYTLDSGVLNGAPEITARTTDHGVDITTRPLHDGVNTLRVWSKDRANRYSATPFMYVFTVAAVAGNGAASEWTFEEAAGTTTATDVTSHQNTATLSASGATRGTGRGGAGTALSLTGTSSYAQTAGPVQVPNPSTGVMMPVRTDNNFTVTARVKLNGNGGTGVYAAVSADGTNTSAYILGYSGPDNKWIFRMAESDVASPSNASVLSDAAATAGKWTHLTATYDAGTRVLRLYVNGSLQTASATLSGGFNASGPVAVGRLMASGANNGFLAGALDDVRVYNFVESATNIGTLAAPLNAVVTFPTGTVVNTGVQLGAVFDGAEDANVTSFKYSIDNTDLGLSATPGGAGGTASVSLPAQTVVGEHLLYVANYDGTRTGPVRQFAFTVRSAVSVFGAIIDLNTFLNVPDALVTLQPGGLSMTTGPEGTFRFEGFAAGTYTVSATAGGPCGLAGSVQVTIDQPDIQVDLFMLPITDDIGHTCDVQAATFTPASGAALSLTGDDAVTQVSLPFPFPFYGQAYYSAWVDTNGLISFRDPGGSRPYAGTAIPAPADPNAVVAAFWDDLVVDASAGVWTETTGSGSSARFTIEWRNVYRRDSSAQRLSFMATLAPDGTVTTNYSNLDNAQERGSEALVGIEAGGGDDGLVYSKDQPILDNNIAIVFDDPEPGNPLALYDLSGALTDAGGAPIVGATVRVEPTGKQVTTTAGGAYAFTDLVADSYTVTSVASGRCGEVALDQVDLTADTVRNLRRGPDYRGMGYACTTGGSGYIAAGTVLSLSGDDAVSTVTLPFTFSFHGGAYTTAKVDTNGVLSFGASAGANTWANGPIPRPAWPNSVIAPFWDDLTIDASASVRTQLSGTAPNRTFTVEWRNAKLNAAPTDRVTVEAILYEDGRISFQYGTATTAAQQGSGATIGLENSSGSLARQYSLWETVVTSNSSITFTPAPTGTISGQLTTARTGAPVAGATITLNPGGSSTTTAADGSYTFTPVKVGELSISASIGGTQCAGQAAKQIINFAGGSSDVDLSLMTAGDEFGYACQSGAETFTPGDVVEAWSGDETVWQKNPPFPIKFYGSSYTSAWISANGLITLTDPAFFGWIGSSPSPLPSAAAEGIPNAAVYVLWDDWVVDASARIATKISGTAPNRQWIVEWRNVVAYDDPTARLSFEVIFEENGTIHLAYTDVNPASGLERGSGSTVGIEDATGSIAFQYLFKESWLATGQGVRYTPTPPAAGSVTGTVTCEGTAVSGATVAVGTRSATTAANGSFTVPSAPAGAYSAIATIPSGTCKGSSAKPVMVTATTPPVTFAATTTPAWSGYTVGEQATTFTPANTTVLPLTGDDNITQITLPFSFKLYGTSYTTAWVDTNGLVAFVNPGSSSSDAWPIPSSPGPEEPNATVYPFWHDWWVDAQSSVRTTTTGSAPNRTFIVEWRNVYSIEDPNIRVTFEVIFEESGNLTFAYADQESTFLELGGGATIGLENAAGTVALQYTYRHPALRPGVGLRFVAPTS
jgi:hypothetical protein